MAALQELVSQPGTLRLELGEMPRDDLRLFLTKSLAVDFVPEEVLSIVSDRAEGNPFFARELAYAMRDAGELIVEWPFAIIPGPLRKLQTISIDALEDELEREAKIEERFT